MPDPTPDHPLCTDQQPSTPPSEEARTTPGRNALRRAAECLRYAWAGASAALARAEQHIMENFRQPPHGG